MDSPQALDHDKPKLGDFSKIALLTLRSSKQTHGHGHATDKDQVRLGDFGRLAAQLPSWHQPLQAMQCYSQTVSTRQHGPPHGAVESSSTVSSVFQDFDAATPPTTPPTTPPAPMEDQNATTHLSSLSAATPRLCRLHGLFYRPSVNGPLIPLSTCPEAHRVPLNRLLRPLHHLDIFTAAQRPEVVANGVHVFLDMSNIAISFQVTLRERYGLDSTARFVPLPKLHFGLLVELLLRGRTAVALNAGCSVSPGKPEPRCVEELRELGFRVDLRERKPVAAASLAPRSRSCLVRSKKCNKTSARHVRGRCPCLYYPSSEGDSCEAPVSVRYVEDMVDETLQTRIAESVMEHFENQGTIVLATGDARPAQYSDGFLVYAERALKMGWDVEVLSWRSSLSSHWKDSRRMKKWAGRLRVIELDSFVDHLLVAS
ncbi:hypothetical protein CDD82_7423 [Ophiocordyceps australis]|uniref:NYN domain-containing protein n=1 Tax=Ophiocordyceps australis TaxID=1399860 RepID=A0A2C5YQQ4_9HYPO|nr:hypothetical protein CDD82_7423 [Ophiocordyceps australis]